MAKRVMLVKTCIHMYSFEADTNENNEQHLLTHFVTGPQCSACINSFSDKHCVFSLQRDKSR